MGKKLPRKCQVINCSRPVTARGLYVKHYRQFLKHGRVIERWELVQNKIEQFKGIARLYLNNSSKFALIDADLITEISKQVWYLDKQDNYVKSNGKIRKLHHLVLPPKKGFFTDHRNRNRLDYRRMNLRYATCSQNSMNSKLQCNNSSGVKGLSYITSQQIWQARISLNRKRYVKRSTKRGVCEAWLKEMRPKLHGEFACEG